MTVSVPITDDGEMEGTEVFTATLTTISNHVVLGDSLATITILDSKNWQYCSHVGSECLSITILDSKNWQYCSHVGSECLSITILDSKNWQYCSHVGSECLLNSLISSFINCCTTCGRRSSLLFHQGFVFRFVKIEVA